MPKLKHKQPTIELNEQFKYALDLMEHTCKNVFITGRAGTGKSTLLDYFRSSTQKRVAILAPTGVAALNVKGQTIHSFFGFKPTITLDEVKKVRFADPKKNIYRKLDAIVIDEISMVRADLLDCVDKFLRLNGPKGNKPFGGIQMIFIGDLYQLPPVVTGAERTAFNSLYQTPYFYSAKVFDSLDMEFVELEKIYRQHDEEFISILNAIRNNTVTEEQLELLNRRCLPEFEPPPDSFYLHLTTTNKLADEINARQLARLRSPLYVFTATIKGEFREEYIPTAADLQVKAGAQIMMVNNDADGRWVNGSIGKIMDFVQDRRGNYVIVVELSDGAVVEVTPYTWEIFKLLVEDEQLKSEVIGRFTQYPLMLAWAVTIHKSQGKTFDKVIIDIGRGAFAHGQTYVALSRCTTLDGIVLKKPILKKHIWTDYKVVKFLTKYQYDKAAQVQPVDDKVEMIRRAIENRALLEITYLKPNDEKSRRVIRPEMVGEMEYQGKSYLGVRAFCLKRNEERVFRVDRILEMRQR
jgi:ATP-dependent exoDNAse (exonuclease V) alpha subunit